MGLNQSDIVDYFTGPAFLPWHRMGNINEWAGPLPQAWIESQKELQILVLRRMREFGMDPVLPAFAGHVPKTISKLYPNASISQLADWAGFPGTYFLSIITCY